jgi:ABC-2 type transport system permease protein
MEQPTTMPVIPQPDAPGADEALVSFGIATAFRDAAISVGIMLGLLYLFPVPWAGLGVVAAWAAAVLLVGGLLLRFRDA